MKQWLWLLCLVPSSLRAQQARTCTVILDSVGGTGRSVEIRKGVFHQFGGGGVIGHCKNDVTHMTSDSVAWYSDLNRMDLVGRVHFTDSTVTLDAARATYFMGDERLEAYGDVDLMNLRTGSRLTGPNLIYRRRAPGIRDTTEINATQRPTVQYRSESDTAGAEPYIIKGERVRLRGNSQAWSAGNVTIDRSDFAGKADSANLDLAGGRGELIDHADVSGQGKGKFNLSGRNIHYRMDDRKLKWVQARGRAEATSDEWRILSDTIEFDLVDQRIQGGRAWTDTTPSRAISAAYTIKADSLALDAPDQKLTELRGYRHAFATSKDSNVVEPDWMAGDTLIARFDTTALGQRILSRLTAKGNARAYYHVPDPDRPKAEPGISYSRGKEIAARFTLVGLDRVDVTGGADGVYLEPGVAKPRTPADSAAAKSPPDTAKSVRS